MDEESIGVLGLLLIVTALVMSQSLQKTHAMPMLAATWNGVVSVLSCSTEASPDCAGDADQAQNGQPLVPYAYSEPVSR